MQSDDPAHLSVGTEVSAKFKGAFCEAKIKKVTKSIKCKVLLKEAPFGSITVDNTSIRGDLLEINQIVDVHHNKQTVKAMIQSVKDCSTYHVVFNDGDEKVLRRTQMCLKGARHFDSAHNLDALPLYNPEQFGSPVVRGMLAKEKKHKKRKMEENSPLKRKRRKDDEESDEEGAKKREKRAAASAASVAIGEMDQGDTEVSCDGSSSGDASDVEKEKERERKKEDKREKSVARSSVARSSVARSPPEEKGEKFSVGEVICFYEDSACRGKWFPAVVVSQKAYRKSPKARPLTRKEVPVRSFQNGKYMTAVHTQLTPFEEQRLTKKVLEAMGTALRAGVDRAQAFVEKETLPGNWERSEVFGEEEPSPSKRKEPEEKKKDTKNKEKEDKEKEKKKEKEKEKKVETESSSSEDSVEEEYGEERDLFVAQLYKFQEERGTPINRAPILGGKDIDLYRFYRVVQHYGGAKKVTANQKWKKVLLRMKLEGCPGATAVTVKNAYIRYLAHFNSFYKNLGWSMEELASSSTTSSPRERRLIRGAMDGKNKVLKKKKTEKKKEPGENESTVEKESSVESSSLKDEKKDKKKEKEVKTTEKNEKHELVVDKEKEKRERRDTDREKLHEEKEKVKEAEHKKEEKKKEEKEKKKVERKKEDSESTDVCEKEKKEKELAHKPSTSQACEKKDKRVEKSTEKEPKRDRKLTESEDEVDGKKKKERRKVSMKEKGSKTEEVLVYHQSDVFCQLYLGQKIRAYHHGKWYDARAVTIQQHPVKLLVDYLVKHQGTTSGDQLSEDIKTYLKDAIAHCEVFVHYLGWNSRYDETITLHKIKVNHKDLEGSQLLFKMADGNRLCESFKTALLTWVKGPEAVMSLEEEETVGSVIGMGGYRPRRVSISQYEQIAAAMERAHKKNMASPPLRSTSISVSQPMKLEDAELKPDVKSLQGTSGYVIPKRTAPSPGRPKTERQNEVAVKRELVSPVPPVPEPIPTPPGPSKPVEKEKPVELPIISSPRHRRQRTLSASSRTTPPMYHISPPAVTVSQNVMIRRFTPRDQQLTPPPEDPPVRQKSPSKSPMPSPAEERAVPGESEPTTSEGSIPQNTSTETFVKRNEQVQTPMVEPFVHEVAKEEIVEKTEEEKVEKKEEKLVETKKEEKHQKKEEKPVEKKKEEKKKEEKPMEKGKEEKLIEKQKEEEPEGRKKDEPAVKEEQEEKKTELPKASKLPEIPKELKKKEEKKVKEHTKEKEKVSKKETKPEEKKERKVEKKTEDLEEKKEEKKKTEEKKKVEENKEEVKEEPLKEDAVDVVEEIKKEEEEVQLEEFVTAKTVLLHHIPSISKTDEEITLEMEEKEEIKEELMNDADDEADDEGPTPSLESDALLSPPESSPVRQPPLKRRKLESEKEAKEDEEDEDEEVDDEEELDQLEEEAKLVCSMQDEPFSDSGSTTPHREDLDDEPEFRDLNAPRPRPGIMSPMRGGRSVKKRRLLNSRHSAMVVDKKYVKHKPKEKAKETPPPQQPQPTTEEHHSENEEDEEESLKIKESYVKRKNNMHKQLEMENNLEDCSILEVECIGVLPPAPSRQADKDFVEYCEGRLQELRQMYLAARAEIQHQEKRMRAVQEKKREHRDKEKQTREQLSSPSQSTSSTATDSL